MFLFRRIVACETGEVASSPADVTVSFTSSGLAGIPDRFSVSGSLPSSFGEPVSLSSQMFFRTASGISPRHYAAYLLLVDFYFLSLYHTSIFLIVEQFFSGNPAFSLRCECKNTTHITCLHYLTGMCTRPASRSCIQSPTCTV